MTLQAVRVFTTLGIPDLMGQGPLPASDLARRTNTDEDALERLLRHLAVCGILNEQSVGMFTLSPIGDLLRSDHAASRRHEFLLDAVGPAYEASLAGMMYSVKAGASSFEKIFGETFWSRLERDSVFAASFDVDMKNNANALGPELSKCFDWSVVSIVADIGGGTGDIISHILRSHQNLTGIILEFAEAAQRAKDAIKRAELADRCQIVEGSFFDQLPSGADVYILCWIIHDWSDSDARTILARCKDAAGSTGRVIVIERPLGDVNNRWTTELDLRMLVYFGARERSIEQYCSLFESSGLRLVNTTELSSQFVVMECAPVT